MGGNRGRLSVVPRLLYRYLRMCMLSSAAMMWSHSAIGTAPELPEFVVESPAPGVYVHYGQQSEMTRANFGDVANLALSSARAAWRSSTRAERMRSAGRCGLRSGALRQFRCAT